MSITKASAATALAGILLGTAVLFGSAGGAYAQLFNRPQAGDPYQGGNDPAALLLRIERLENQVRSLTGQLEEAQFQNRRLEDQARRLQEAGAHAGEASSAHAGQPQRRGDVYEPAREAGTPTPLPSAGRRGDAFDPSQYPGAPGAPRLLGSIEGQAGLSGPLGDPVIDEGPYDTDPSAPLDLLNPRRGQGSAPANHAAQGYPPDYPQAAPSRSPSHAGAPLPSLPEQPRQPQGAQQQAAMPVDPAPRAPVSTLPPPGPRELLDRSNSALRSGDLDRAETDYKEFLKRYPSSRLAPEATFNLGDVYARRGRHREAAEQFLKVTADFSKSTQAPQSLHRLGQSLERLGAKEQACAAWAEVPRKYPSAARTIRAAAERDIKRASC